LRGGPEPGEILCRLDEISDPGAKGFTTFTGEMMFRGFVVRRGDEVLGYLDRCPHIGTPLTLGDDRYLTRDGAMILCSTHGALFRIEDGLCLGGPCIGRSLAPWPIALRDGAVIAA
jgi:nitrite reductase/ring-hydroxylating ferredoxin subunit